MNNPLSTKIEDFTNYNSVIGKCSKSLLDQLKSEQMGFLKEILGKPTRIERVFRASDHGFSAITFHEKCNNINDTLVLVRTEFGKTIGGFTHYPWLPGSPGHTNDAGRRAFIFSVDMKEKFVPQGDNHLIYNWDGYGPVFGGTTKSDIYVADDCNNNRNSYGNFPSVYNRAGGDKMVRNQDSYRMFSGATDGYQFRVVEYEVFKVWYQ